MITLIFVGGLTILMYLIFNDMHAQRAREHRRRSGGRDLRRRHPDDN